MNIAIRAGILCLGAHAPFKQTPSAVKGKLSAGSRAFLAGELSTSDRLHFLPAILLLLFLFLIPGKSTAQVTYPVTYYVPLQETDLRNSLAQLFPNTGDDVRTVISVVMQENGGVIVYDHWEDGYEVDINNPVQSTTLILGDFNAANGNLASLPAGARTIPSLANDNAIFAGVTIIFENSMFANPRGNSPIRFDARDRISSNRALAVSRAGWALNPGTVLAGAVEMLDTSSFGTQFIVPVGQNTINQGSGTNLFFEMTHLYVQAAENNTQVTVDANGPNISGGISTTTLQQGQSLRIVNILEGATVSATKKVQAFAITGDVDAIYESRWFTLVPNNLLGKTYYNPVISASASNPTSVFLFNPQSTAITVNFTTSNNSGSFSIPAYDGARYDMPLNNSGVRFQSSQNFIAVAVIDSDESNTTHDWGMTLIPEGYLSSAFVVVVP